MNMATASNVGVSHKTHYARLGHASQELIPKMLQELYFLLNTQANYIKFVLQTPTSKERDCLQKSGTKSKQHQQKDM